MLESETLWITIATEWQPAYTSARSARIQKKKPIYRHDLATVTHRPHMFFVSRSNIPQFAHLSD